MALPRSAHTVESRRVSTCFDSTFATRNCVQIFAIIKRHNHFGGVDSSAAQDAEMQLAGVNLELMREMSFY